MANKNYTLIPVLAAIILIPQLLFWWLAPEAAVARLAVYIGGSILTVGIPVAYFMTYWKSNLRKSAGLSIVSFVLEIAVVVISALLLGINATVRTTAFSFVITALTALIVLLPMINSALKAERQGVYSANLSVESNERSMSDDRSHDVHATGLHSQPAVPAHTSRQGQTSKPLPPRNR